jgi:kynurenine formamidase
MLTNLSYHLSESTPFPKGLPGPTLKRLYALANGDACNSFYLTTNNHAGTHVDGPCHFNPEGRSITDYELSELVFTKSSVLDIQVSKDELILPKHLERASACRRDCDLLLIRSGFGKYRSDADTYIEHNPGFSAAAADFLMRQFDGLRAIGMDFASVAATSHMDEGCEAHRVFLGCGSFSARPVLLIEDVRLPDLMPTLHKIYLIPWFFEGLDSAPCTLFAETDESTSLSLDETTLKKSLSGRKMNLR